MKYVVRLIFELGETAAYFVEQSGITPYNVIGDRVLVYVFATTTAAFELLCIVTQLTAFLKDTSCYIVEEGQRDFC